MSGPDRFAVMSILKLALAKAMPAIRGLVNQAQAALYSPIGRPSIVAASA